MESKGIDLYVYSSGSVAAQKLLFGYSDEGDITHLFSGYFDNLHWRQARGAVLSKYYGANGHRPSQILFLSDIHQS